jgi:hypothetical protein
LFTDPHSGKNPEKIAPEEDKFDSGRILTESIFSNSKIVSM